MPESSFQKITSRDNARLKYARQIRDGRVKDKMFIEGLRLCEEAIRANLKITDIFYSENFSTDERRREFLEAVEKFQTIECSEKAFDSLADTKTSQGVIIIAEAPQNGKEKLEAELSKNDAPLIVLLHEINNPSNLGAIIRTALAAGVSGIITTKNSADVFSPKSLRAAMGAAFRLPVWSNADYFHVLEWAKENELQSVCADINSHADYTQIDWKKGKLLILGSEGHGLSESERAAADEGLLIPMANEVESLNIAVAAGIILFEAKNQRSKI